MRTGHTAAARHLMFAYGAVLTRRASKLAPGGSTHVISSPHRESGWQNRLRCNRICPEIQNSPGRWGSQRHSRRRDMAPPHGRLRGISAADSKYPTRTRAPSAASLFLEATRKKIPGASGSSPQEGRGTRAAASSRRVPSTWRSRFPLETGERGDPRRSDCSGGALHGGVQRCGMTFCRSRRR